MTIRKAIGAVKDRTSIRIAKSTSNMSPGLEVAIVKATSHHKDPADEKYIREVVNMVSSSNGYVQANCVAVAALSKRLSKTRDWIVAIKSLILVHRLFVDAGPLFQIEIMHSCTERGTRVLKMKDFRDDAHANSWDYSKFVRTYALYLDQKLELTMFERSISGGGDGMPRDNCYVGSSKDPVVRVYRGVDYRSVTREEENSIVTPLRDMALETIFAKMRLLQGLMDRVMACRPSGMAKHCRLVLVAMRPVVRESFKLYADICEVLEILLDNFFEMKYSWSVKAFNVYARAAKQIDELIHFYNWCNDIGVCRTYETPVVKRITDKLMETFRDTLRNRAEGTEYPERMEPPPAPRHEEPEEPYMNDIKEVFPPKDSKEILCDMVEEPEKPYMNDIKALPSIPQPELDDPKPQQYNVDLINLMDDDDLTTYNQGNNFPLCLLSGPPAKEKEHWQEMSCDGQSDVITLFKQSPADEDGKADWEIALVESASNLSEQKNAMSCGFDSVLLSGLYGLEMVTQHISTLEIDGGSASSVASPGQGSTPVLLLPAPVESFQTINQDGPPPPQMMPYWMPPGGYY